MFVLHSIYIGVQMQALPNNEQKINTARPELHLVPVRSPWYHLGIAFISPYSPPFATGNKYVLNVSDYFTMFGWLRALPAKEASGVAQALCEVSMEHIHYLYA